MALPRLHLFEFNDSPWAPAPVREALIEALSLALDWGRMLRGAVGPFATFLEQTGATEVLDLCAGAGAPAAILARELRLAGKRPPRFLLTDLMPHAGLWAALQEQDPEAIDFVEGPVDATCIPPGLGAGKARMIVNALHHLPPRLAGEVLRGACAGGPGVFVIEGFERSPARFFPMAPMGLWALVANLWRTPRNRLAKVLLFPATLLAAPWDGLVSTLRVYTEAELREMAAPLSGEFDLSYGTFPFPLGGRMYWFSAVRRPGRATSSAAPGSRPSRPSPRSSP
jgi:hypothetical protein